MKITFKISNKVRASKYKNVFKKGYTPNWTTEIFTVDQIMRAEPVMCKLKYCQDQAIAGSFYWEELSKVKYLDIYLVGKVTKRRSNQVYDKWLDFDSSRYT